MVLLQKWPFFQLFFLGTIRKKNVFYNILERKNAFLGYKNKKFKKSKNWHFSKRVNPWFWSKNGHFSNLFTLGNIVHENVIYDIPERKKGLTHGLAPEMAFFKTFFFRQYQPEKCLLGYPRTLKRFRRL